MQQQFHQNIPCALVTTIKCNQALCSGSLGALLTGKSSVCLIAVEQALTKPKANKWLVAETCDDAVVVSKKNTTRFRRSSWRRNNYSLQNFGMKQY